MSQSQSGGVSIRITESFKKRARKKPAPMQEAIAECINRLATDRTHPGLRMHKMKGHEDIWEAYIDRSNRVTFEWDGSTIVLRNNCNHDMLKRSP